MPRKRPSPSNRSTGDEGFSEEIESDSSLELNSRRNTYRKKPQRKCSSKQSQNDSPESTEKLQREKLQGNYSEKNEKRPSIIKIFRRIDRRAKNIYLVDDKVEDRNELATPSNSENDSSIFNGEKSPHSLESTKNLCNKNRKSLFNGCATQMDLRTFKEHPTRTVDINCGKHDFEEVNMRNLSGDHDNSYPSMRSIDKISEKAEIGISNQPFDPENLYSPVTDIVETSSSDDAWNQSRDTDNLYSPVTDIAETPGSDDAWNQSRDADNLYSSVTNIAKTPDDSNDPGNQSRVTNNLYSPVTGIAETPGSDDAWNQHHDTYNLYSPVTDITQTHCTDDIWNQPRNTNDLYTSETDIDQTPSRDHVCSQRLRSDSGVSDSSVTEIEKTSNNYDAFELLNGDLWGSNDDKIPNYKTDNFNFSLNSDIGALDLLVAEYEYKLNEVQDKTYRQALSNQLDTSKTFFTDSDS